MSISKQPFLNLYLTPEPTKNSSRKPAYIVFISNTNFTGSDGCNTFWGAYKYDNKQGFTIRSVKQTELKCRENHKVFSPYFMQKKTFEIKNNTFILYDKDKKETEKLYFFKDTKSEKILLGDWTFKESSTQKFTHLEKTDKRIHINFLSNQDFEIYCNKDAENKKFVYFSGVFNADKNNLILFKSVERIISLLPDEEDMRIAFPLKNPKSWTIKDEKLIINTEESTFIFEK